MQIGEEARKQVKRGDKAGAGIFAQLPQPTLMYDSSNKLCNLLVSSDKNGVEFSLYTILALCRLISLAVIDLFLLIGVHGDDVEGVVFEPVEYPLLGGGVCGYVLYDMLTSAMSVKETGVSL